MFEEQRAQVADRSGALEHVDLNTSRRRCSVALTCTARLSGNGEDDLAEAVFVRYRNLRSWEIECDLQRASRQLILFGLCWCSARLRYADWRPGESIGLDRAKLLREIISKLTTLSEMVNK